MIANGSFQLEFETSINSIFALSLVLGLKVTTRQAKTGFSSPVFGFLPGRAALSRSSNLPKPDILTDSACSKVAFISSKNQLDQIFCHGFAQAQAIE